MPSKLHKLHVLNMLMHTSYDLAERGDVTATMHIGRGDYDSAMQEIESVRWILTNRVVVDQGVLAGNVLVVAK